MLEKLRAMSEQARKAFSLVLTIFIFGSILFVWLSSSDARSQEELVREKTVAPVSGFIAMFGGLIDEVKDAISSTPTFVNGAGATSTSQTTKSPSSDFDVSGIVIIDPLLSTPK